jgi:ribosomal protein S18 acetylase RimI-like enzyme
VSYFYMEASAEYLIREAVLADAADIAKLNIEVWRTTYAGLMDASILDAMEFDTYYKKWERILSMTDGRSRWCFVATVSGKSVGYLSAGINQDNDEYEATLYALYLLASEQSRGIGIALFSRALEAFRSNGIGSFKLYVLKDNVVGRRFYDRFDPDARADASITIEGNAYCDMLYGWHSIPNVLPSRVSE